MVYFFIIYFIVLFDDYNVGTNYHFRHFIMQHINNLKNRLRILRKKSRVRGRIIIKKSLLNNKQRDNEKQKRKGNDTIDHIKSSLYKTKLFIIDLTI